MSPSRKSVWSAIATVCSRARARHSGSAIRRRHRVVPSPEDLRERGHPAPLVRVLERHLRGDEARARLRPEITAGGDATLEHRHRRAGAAEEAGDHRAPRDAHAVLGREPRDVFDLEQRAVGDLDDAARRFSASVCDERPQLALVGEAARHRAALRPLVRRRLRRRDADGTGVAAPRAIDAADLGELVVGRGARERGVGAHHIEADHAVRHERGDVDALRQRAQRVEVLREGLEVATRSRAAASRASCLRRARASP